MACRPRARQLDACVVWIERRGEAAGCKRVGWGRVDDAGTMVRSGGEDDGGRDRGRGKRVYFLQGPLRQTYG